MGCSSSVSIGVSDRLIWGRGARRDRTPPSSEDETSLAQVESGASHVPASLESPAEVREENHFGRPKHDQHRTSDTTSSDDDDGDDDDDKQPPCSASRHNRESFDSSEGFEVPCEQADESGDVVPAEDLATGGTRPFSAHTTTEGNFISNASDSEDGEYAMPEEQLPESSWNTPSQPILM